MMNRQIVLRSRPESNPTPDNFEIVQIAVPPVTDGHVLRRTIYLSLDPYMRGRMSDAESYAASVALRQVMVGHTVSEVLESRNPAFAKGDYVLGYDGWQEYGLSTGRDLRKLDPAVAPISTALSVLGMPGMTAWYGLLEIGRPKSGETVVVSAASGAVGSVVGQIAKIKGCRAIGVAGSPDKCQYVVDELGFDACVNYKADSFRQDLATACPSGIDVYFENTGGAIFAAVLRLLAVNARIPLCGLIADYNLPTLPGTPNLRPLLVKRVLLQGFIITDHPDHTAAFLNECGPWFRDGRLKYREDIVEGFEQAPTALTKLFDGRNFGKLIVQVSNDRTRKS